MRSNATHCNGRQCSVNSPSQKRTCSVWQVPKPGSKFQPKDLDSVSRFFQLTADFCLATRGNNLDAAKNVSQESQNLRVFLANFCLYLCSLCFSTTQTLWSTEWRSRHISLAQKTCSQRSTRKFQMKGRRHLGFHFTKGLQKLGSSRGFPKS